LKAQLPPRKEAAPSLRRRRIVPPACFCGLYHALPKIGDCSLSYRRLRFERHITEGGLPLPRRERYRPPWSGLRGHVPTYPDQTFAPGTTAAFLLPRATYKSSQTSGLLRQKEGLRTSRRAGLARIIHERSPQSKQGLAIVLGRGVPRQGADEPS
ncbi:MAG: hypothetical protein QOI57_3121, partial [Rubrobacteraceae bacterium]|nr:hypothetical protein [Rubrobacteraceae bacterium]